MPTAGYSGKPLAEKLGIGPDTRVLAINAPPNYRAILEPLPAGVTFARGASGRDVHLVHLFVSRRARLEKELPRRRRKMADTAVLWVSWPKKSSGVPTDVTEDVIREVALPLGLVDTKVCAVDDVWSGLKLMVRRSARGWRAAG